MRILRTLTAAVLVAGLAVGCGADADEPDTGSASGQDATNAANKDGDGTDGDDDGDADAGGTVDISGIPDAEDSDGPGGNPDNTTATDDGPVTWGSWQVVGEIEVGKDSIDDFTIAFDVENIGDEKTWGRFNVRFTKDGEWVGTGFCTTYDTEPGATTEALCTSSDDHDPGYTEITIWDAV